MPQDGSNHSRHPSLGVLSSGTETLFPNGHPGKVYQAAANTSLQVLDKTVLGYNAVFGLQDDTHLAGNQYSLVGSIAPIAQLAWQPFSSLVLVKVPPRKLLPVLLLGWGIAQACTSAAHNFGGLMAARFILGLFEAGCLPLFSIITSTWYRRSEQPLRVAAWYGTNGLATMVGAALSYGLGKINSPVLASCTSFLP